MSCFSGKKANKRDKIPRKKEIKTVKNIVMKTRTEIIKQLLNISSKRKDINYFNQLTNLSDEQLQKELEKCLN